MIINMGGGATSKSVPEVKAGDINFYTGTSLESYTSNPIGTPIKIISFKMHVKGSVRVTTKAWADTYASGYVWYEKNGTKQGSDFSIDGRHQSNATMCVRDITVENDDIITIYCKTTGSNYQYIYLDGMSIGTDKSVLFTIQP